MPPPRVRPPTPVVEMIPPVVASPNGYVAAFRSPQVAPPETRAVWVERVDPDAAHGREVDHDAPVGGAEARHAVASAPDGDGQVVVGGEADGRHHVPGVDRLDDHVRPLVDHAVADRAGLRRTPGRPLSSRSP